MVVSNEADVNEIYLCYFLVCKNWSKFGNSSKSKNTLDDKKTKLAPSKVKDLEERAKAMSDAVKKWMKNNEYSAISKVWWLKTTKDSDYKKLIPKHNWKKYPPDILVETKNNMKLGISAKSSNSKSAKPPIKNPGLGTIQKILKTKTDFDIVAKKVLRKNFPGIQFKKDWLRQTNNAHIRKETKKMGKSIRCTICQKMFDELKKLESSGKLLKFILEEWIDVPREPPYIKAWGYGKDENYGAKIVDPLLTKSKLEKMSLTLEKRGFSVIVKGNGKKLMGFRSKYESEQMASGLKFSVDVPASIDFI